MTKTPNKKCKTTNTKKSSKSKQKTTGSAKQLKKLRSNTAVTNHTGGKRKKVEALLDSSDDSSFTDKEESSQNNDEEVMNRKPFAKVDKSKERKASTESHTFQNDIYYQKSKDLFDEHFVNDITNRKQTASKYPTKANVDLFIQILRNTPISSESPKKTTHMVRRKYTIGTEDNTEKLYLKSKTTMIGNRIVPFEDVFDVLYTTCKEVGHKESEVSKKITTKYSNIPHTLVRWFQSKICLGCLNTPKHGNCKKSAIDLSKEEPLTITNEDQNISKKRNSVELFPTPQPASSVSHKTGIPKSCFSKIKFEFVTTDDNDNPLVKLTAGENLFGRHFQEKSSETVLSHAM